MTAKTLCQQTCEGIKVFRPLLKFKLSCVTLGFLLQVSLYQSIGNMKLADIFRLTVKIHFTYESILFENGFRTVQ